MNKEWFCRVVKEIREYLARIDKLEEALGCGACEDMYELPGVITDYLEEQSGKAWPDNIYEDIYNIFTLSPEDIWDKIEKLEVKNND